MPVHRFQDEDPVANRQELTTRLLEEWRHGAGGEGAPLIEIHEGGRVFGLLGKPLKFRVIWDQWTGIEPGDRASIIMDVFQQVADEPEDILRITSVMGLTPDEASRR